jgi:transcriptional regulator with XRE-family HTH domain
MNDLVNDLEGLFQDEEARYAYAESFSNANIAAQIKLLRENAAMNQGQLAQAMGTKQSGVSRLENVNYSAWKIETLRKIARVFGVRLKVSFEEFGTIIDEVQGFTKRNLLPRRFEDDPAFNGSKNEKLKRHKIRSSGRRIKNSYLKRNKSQAPRKPPRSEPSRTYSLEVAAALPSANWQQQRMANETLSLNGNNQNNSGTSIASGISGNNSVHFREGYRP